jgi:hypothetical protein
MLLEDTDRIYATEQRLREAASPKPGGRLDELLWSPLVREEVPELRKKLSSHPRARRILNQWEAQMAYNDHLLRKWYLVGDRRLHLERHGDDLTSEYIESLGTTPVSRMLEEISRYKPKPR